MLYPLSYEGLRPYRTDQAIPTSPRAAHGAPTGAERWSELPSLVERVRGAPTGLSGENIDRRYVRERLRDCPCAGTVRCAYRGSGAGHVMREEAVTPRLLGIRPPPASGGLEPATAGVARAVGWRID